MSHEERRAAIDPQDTAAGRAYLISLARSGQPSSLEKSTLPIWRHYWTGVKKEKSLLSTHHIWVVGQDQARMLQTIDTLEDAKVFLRDNDFGRCLCFIEPFRMDEQNLKHAPGRVDWDKTAQSEWRRWRLIETPWNWTFDPKKVPANVNRTKRAFHYTQFTMVKTYTKRCFECWWIMQSALAEKVDESQGIDGRTRAFLAMVEQRYGSKEALRELLKETP